MKPAVEIAGAGIAGLTAGLAFAQKGWQVRVHEQNSELGNPGEGIHLGRMDCACSMRSARWPR